MRVRSEAIVENRAIAAELEDADMESEIADWSKMSTVVRFKVMSAKADMLVVFYLAQSHLIDPETAKKRLSALSEQLKDQLNKALSG